MGPPRAYALVALVIGLAVGLGLGLGLELPRPAVDGAEAATTSRVTWRCLAEATSGMYLMIHNASDGTVTATVTTYRQSGGPPDLVWPIDVHKRQTNSLGPGGNAAAVEVRGPSSLWVAAYNANNDGLLACYKKGG